jgi:hypothetical protein
MTKAIISLGYTDYVLEAADALKVIELLNSAEHYKYHYKRDENGDGKYAHYIWDGLDTDRSNSLTTLKMLPDATYRMAKLAGRPPE